MAQIRTGIQEVDPRHQLDVARLEAWVREHVEGFSGSLQVRQFVGGQSNPTYHLSDGRHEWVLRRNRSGHYFSPGLINGQPVRFLLDTGATHTSVPAHLAQGLGLRPGAPSTVSTANGTVTVRATRIDALDIGPFRFAGAPAHLNPGMRDDDVLLGMSVLKHLEFTQRGDVLVIRKPAG